MADEILVELKKANRALALLATVAMRPALLKFEKDVLRTDNRIKMFRLFDGERTPTAVAGLTGVSGQGVRDLIKDLTGKGFVEIPDSGPQVATVRYEAIFDWYHDNAEATPTQG